MDVVEGELVTETFEFDGGRSVTAYVPTRRPEAIVFAGDGATIAAWGSVLQGADVVPTMVVGVHRSPDEDVRLSEYSPGFDPARFAAHEGFVIGDVRRWVGMRFGVRFAVERTAIFGVSAGGSSPSRWG